MKNIAVIILVLFNVGLVFCQDTDETKYNKYESTTYQISYPKNLKFELKKTLASGIIEGGFYLVKDDRNLLLIELEVTNCERLGMGMIGLKNAIEKGKRVTKRKTKLDFEYDVMEYKDGGNSTIEYLFCSNNLIYHLTGTYRSEQSKPEIQNIMNSFELK